AGIIGRQAIAAEIDPQFAIIKNGIRRDEVGLAGRDIHSRAAVESNSVRGAPGGPADRVIRAGNEIDSVLGISERERSRGVRADPVSLHSRVDAALQKDAVTSYTAGIAHEISRAVSANRDEGAGLQGYSFARGAQAVA